MDYPTLLLENLELIDRIIHFVARRHRMPFADVEEFTSVVRLKLIDRDFAIFRRFQGRSNLTTYLTTVIERIYLDDCVTRWGRWRPSAIARRLGPMALALEQLLFRDSLTVSEAVGVLRSRPDVTETDDELTELARQLPVRAAHRGGVPIDPTAAVLDRAEEDPGLSLSEDSEIAAHVGGALAAAVDALSPEDRVILKLRFVDGCTVARVAAIMGLEMQVVGRRLARLSTVLRRELTAGGITAADADRLIGHTALTLAGLLEKISTAVPAACENEEVRPSNG